MIIERISVTDLTEAASDSWPFSIPAIEAISNSGLELTSSITFLIGENGSGKSTLIEGIADAYGLDSRGGHGGRKYASSATRGILSENLRLELTRLGSEMRRRHSKGFFLRAETAFDVLNFMSDHNVSGYGDRRSLEVSHGESYLQVITGGRLNEPGLYLFDEPEAALSFQSCLALMQAFLQIVDSGSQVICATHSPLLSALPQASVLQLSSEGISQVAWDEADLVANWRQFLASPDRYLRYLG